ncbi:phosphoglucomutase/phosphomannomutase family protein [bacterium]|nr:phosphoglucomutase/phosphomannomutase family protein [bacterium]
MSNIKFGTDGWRAIIADDYTVENVLRVAEATALWIKQNNKALKVIIGHDCRFGGPMFRDAAISVFLQEGIKVLTSEGFVSTPMVSLSSLKHNASAGIVITASHNPPTYNGYKIKAEYGGPAIQEEIEAVEALIPKESKYSVLSSSEIKNHDQVEWIDMEQEYIDHVNEHFDLDKIRNSGMKFAYDAMYGAGQNVIRRILPETALLHATENPGFMGQAPEPIAKNLTELSKLIKENSYIVSGLATDGDADRIGLFDENGNFVDSHHIILLLIRYLVEFKNEKGKVHTSFSCTSKIDRLCEHYNLPHNTTKIGFKYICKQMIEEPSLLGGEESGGIAVSTHIPERDGIWMGLILWEYMAKTGKLLSELISEVYDLIGSFAMERYDLKVEESKKVAIIEACKEGNYSKFGDYSVQSTENLDGFKFHLNENSWVMIRPSGTEPLLRVYCQSPTYEETIKILDQTKETILS